MSIQSMTGFARAAGELDGMSFAWEVRSVNGKGLDLRLRLPAGFDGLEAAARQAVGRRFARGSVQATLTVDRRDARPAPVVNEAFLAELAALARRLVDEFGAAPARADGLLALPGVLAAPEATEMAAAAGSEAGRLALSLFDEALWGLETARRGEGAALGPILERHLAAIEELTARVEADPSREPAAIRERLAAQLALLLAQPGLDEERLAAEAALIATRADVREELDRLRTHCAAARSLLGQGGPVGRRLDFLGQEFNREANTLCSKSNASAITAAGLELKAVVDQFREQVQNLE